MSLVLTLHKFWSLLHPLGKYLFKVNKKEIWTTSKDVLLVSLLLILHWYLHNEWYLFMHTKICSKLTQQDVFRMSMVLIWNLLIKFELAIGHWLMSSMLLSGIYGLAVKSQHSINISVRKYELVHEDVLPILLQK